MPSGFVHHDYILTFTIADPERRSRVVALCADAWQGEAVTEGTWEVSNDLGPEEMETALLALLGEGDRLAYYYLSDSKRIFRVLLA